MKIKFISDYLTLAYIFASFELILAYHVQQANRLQHHRHRHRVQQDSENSRSGISYNIEPGIYNYDQHRFIDPDFEQLAESAKDPNNLKNGIYHDGAVTYDLGLPNYEVLNPYEPPEIITADHPHYQEQLNYIQLTNNFTIEDFGVTTLLHSDKLLKLSEHNATTITDKPEPATTTLEDLKSSSALPPPTPSPPPPLKKLKTLKKDNIDEHLKKTQDKIKKLSDKPKLKSGNHKINATTKNVNKTLKPTAHSTSTSTDQTISSVSNEDTNQPQLHTHYPIPISIETFDKDDDFLKSFYGQSVLLAPPSISTETETQHYANTILSLPYLNSEDTSYFNPMLSDQKRSLRLTTVDNFETTYYTSTERSLEESTIPQDSAP